MNLKENMGTYRGGFARVKMVKKKCNCMTNSKIILKAYYKFKY